MLDRPPHRFLELSHKLPPPLLAQIGEPDLLHQIVIGDHPSVYQPEYHPVDYERLENLGYV